MSPLTPLQASFDTLEARITVEVARRIGCRIALRVGTEISGCRVLCLDRTAHPFVSAEEAPAACTLEVGLLEDWLAIIAGQLTLTVALMSGRMTVQGNLTAAMKLDRWVLSLPA